MPAVLLAFDVLRCEGADLTGQPLRDRRAILESLLAANHACLQLIAQTEAVEEAEDWLRLLPNIEGVVAKRWAGRYLPGQRDWVKVKRRRTVDCVVIGVAGDHNRPWLVLGLPRFKVESQVSIPAGEHQVRMEFAYDGGGLGKGGAVTLYLDGNKIGEGRVDATVPLAFSTDETTDIGRDTGTPVSHDYGQHDSAFSGRVRWVQIDLADAAQNLDHLIAPEQRLRIAMARQ